MPDNSGILKKSRFGTHERDVEKHIPAQSALVVPCPLCTCFSSDVGRFCSFSFATFLYRIYAESDESPPFPFPEKGFPSFFLAPEAIVGEWDG